MANDNRVNNMISVMKSSEEFMTALKAMAQTTAIESGDPSFARFMQAMTEVCRDDVKAIFGDVKAATKTPKEAKSKTSRGPVDNTWRGEQKELFSGRGQQWIYVSLDQVNEHILVDDEVTPFFRDAGQAWVRYLGPRIEGDEKMAAFEIRTSGSKIPGGKTIYISHEDIMAGEFTRLEDGKTPAQLGLEETKKASQGEEIEMSRPDEVNKVEVSDELLMVEDEEEIDEDLF
jgi:hypothetical protein